MTKVFRVKFYKSLAILLILLGLSLVLAFGGLKAYFSNHRLQTELARLKAQDAELDALEVGHLQLEIDFDWVPRFAIAAKNLSYQLPERCETSAVTVDRVLAQVSWEGLFAGEFKVAGIRIGQLAADLTRFDQCSKALNEIKNIPQQVDAAISDSAVAIGEKKDEKKQIIEEKPAIEARPTDTKATEAANEPRAENPTVFSSMEIERVRLSWRDQIWQVNRLVLSEFIPGQPIQMQSQVTLELPGLTDYEFPRFQVSAKLDEKNIEGVIRGKWKEGDISIEGEWHADLGGRPVYRLKTFLTNIPLSPLSEVLHEYSLWKKPLSYKSVWVSCEALITGDRQIRSGTVTLDTCSLAGELGGIRLPHLELSYANDDFEKFKIEKAFEINVKQVSVKKVMDVFGIDMMGGILKSFGFLDGAATIAESGESEFVGEITDVFVGFSRANVRAQQKLSLIKGKFAVSAGRVSGQLDELKVDEGAFAGELSFNFDRQFKEGKVQVGVGELQFSPKIRRLLVDGDMSPISIFGKFDISENRLTRWEGELGVDTITREDFVVDAVKVSSSFVDQVLALKMSAESGWLVKDSKLFRWMQPMFFGHDFEDDRIPLRELKTQFEVKDKKWNWTRAQVYLDPKPIVLSSEGQLGSDNEYEAWINIDFPDYKLVKWDLSGSARDPKLNPNAENMRELARQQGKKQIKNKAEK